jgi:hypothetical protein
MKRRIERLNQWMEIHEFRREVKEILMAFADSVAKLQTDLDKLIAENGPAAVATAVAAALVAQDASHAAAVDTVGAKVTAALTPPAAPAA